MTLSLEEDIEVGVCRFSVDRRGFVGVYEQGRIQSNVVGGGGGGCQNCWGGCERDGAKRRPASATEEALAEGAAAGVWGRKNRSPRVLECT